MRLTITSPQHQLYQGDMKTSPTIGSADEFSTPEASTTEKMDDKIVTDDQIFRRSQASK
jgi:hypothetical protein